MEIETVTYLNTITPQANLSVLKSLEFFGLTTKNPDEVLACVKSQPINISVLNTAAELLMLHQIGATKYFNKRISPALEYMNSNAKTREDHFMLIAAVDECGLSFNPSVSISFFRAMEEENGAFGGSVLNNAICSSALLRIGEKLKKPETVKNILLSAQQDDGGFAEKGGKSDLWVSYCVMRALDLLNVRPNVTRLQNWVLKIYNTSSPDLIYQCLSILDWISRPVIESARSGNLAQLKEYLQQGTTPDIMDLQGWTPLLAASVRGQAQVVEYLLSGNSADINIRFRDADASPAFWAGQSGSLDTAKAILKYAPEQLFDISTVNGHTILLQAAFFGSEKHLELARWILENASEEDRLKLTTATNVRGYNCLTMSRLWENKPMENLFSFYDKSTEQDRKEYLNRLLAKIAPPHSETDKFIQIISHGFTTLNLQEVIDQLQDVMRNPGFDINHLGGPLSQTPIIATITGTDSSDESAKFRLELARFLLNNGADPDIEEKHPMGVDAVIRAAVLNHFDILKLISEYMKPLAFAAALNRPPPINGQTALQDTVHRALTTSEEELSKHLEQIKWCISKGARYDIEDHTGTSPEKLAKQALSDSVYKERAGIVIEALGINYPPVL